MRRTVHKTTINLEDIRDSVEITCPLGSEILSAAVQYPGQISIWFRCDPSRLMRKRTIYIVGTGNLAPCKARFISTVILMDGHLVLHLFDQGE